MTTSLKRKQDSLDDQQTITTTTTTTTTTETTSVLLRPNHQNVLIRRVFIQAIQSLKEGSTDQIESVMSKINDYHAENVAQLMDVISGDIILLDTPVGRSLIGSIMKLSWIDQGEIFDESLLSFFTLLVNAMPKWWNQVMEKVMQGLSLQGDHVKSHILIRKLIHLVPMGINSLPKIIKNCYPHKYSEGDSNVIYVKNLLHLTSYLPELESTVWSLIVRNVVTLDVDLQNLIDDVDDDDLDEALGLDSDDEDEDDEDDDDRSESESESDDSSDEDASGDESGDSSDDEQSVSETRSSSEPDAAYIQSISNIKTLSTKLDKIMNVLLDTIQERLTDESISNGKGITLFLILINVFKTIILPTHGTRVTQYILFYASQLDHELTDAFIVVLFQTVFGDGDGDSKDTSSLKFATSNSKSVLLGTPMNIRVKCAQYIASFIARGKSLTKDQLANVIKLIVDWCNVYIKSVEELEFGGSSSSGSSANEQNGPYQGKTDHTLPSRHPLLYALIQSLMYIICFRRKDLRLDDGSWICQVDKFFTRLMVSKLDILRWTNETVVLIFARVAQKEGICYAWWGVEKLRKERVQNATNPSKEIPDEQEQPVEKKKSSENEELTATTEGSLKRTQELLDLESWFPFDPLLLNDLKKRISALYVEWEDDDE